VNKCAKEFCERVKNELLKYDGSFHVVPLINQTKDNNWVVSVSKYGDDNDLHSATLIFDRELWQLSLKDYIDYIKESQ